VAKPVPRVCGSDRAHATQSSVVLSYLLALARASTRIYFPLRSISKKSCSIANTIGRA
jgi:hypothetical protein